ncbi:voltage-gated hydrogen channel 1-like [Argopecten irradians]|uniref:voltage-gated hydrogen channel 1-like n=1 Tax=Argopecten irradians TaxID=31199 RepID=UPI003717EB3C
MALVMEDKESLEKLSLAAEHGSTEPEIKSTRERLAEFMKSNLIQYGIISLVVLDSIIVILEFLIDLEMIHIPENDIGGSHSPMLNSSMNYTMDHYTDIISTSYPIEEHPDAHLDSEHSSHSMVASHADHLDYNSSHTGHNHTSGHAHHHTNKEFAEHILHYASLTILSIFVVEVMAKIYAEGTHLLKHKAEVFDAIVVLVSFTLDIIFSFVNVTEAARDAAGLMVILRLWRITRIINGVIISVKMDADKKIEEQKAARSRAEEEVEKLKTQVSSLEAELERLQVHLRLLEEGKAGQNLDENINK